MSDSVSFDRAASYYDATRVTDEETLRGVVDLLERDVAAGDGPVLEIGVGTGALAVPLSVRGVRVVGVDLSGEMMARLRDKSTGVGLAQADATRLPFRDAAFGGAYARWVLHLIPAWRDAVTELCRITERGGVIAIEPGGFSGRWREVMDRMIREIGPDAEPVGLSRDREPEALDEVFTNAGAHPLGVVEAPGHFVSSLSTFFDEALARTYSWTWRARDEDLQRAVTNVRSWAAEHSTSGMDPSTPRRPCVGTATGCRAPRSRRGGRRRRARRRRRASPPARPGPGHRIAQSRRRGPSRGRRRRRRLVDEVDAGRLATRCGCSRRFRSSIVSPSCCSAAVVCSSAPA